MRRLCFCAYNSVNTTFSSFFWRSQVYIITNPIFFIPLYHGDDFCTLNAGILRNLLKWLFQGTPNNSHANFQVVIEG